MLNKERSEQIFGGAFLIGLAVLFITGYWWPGILFVIAIAMIVRSVAEGKSWSDERGALVLLVIGVIFALPVLGFLGGNWLPLLLIGIGAYMLFGQQLGLRGGDHRDITPPPSEKSKNDLL